MTERKEGGEAGKGDARRKREERKMRVFSGECVLFLCVWNTIARLKLKRRSTMMAFLYRK